MTSKQIIAKIRLLGYDISTSKNALTGSFCYTISEYKSNADGSIYDNNISFEIDTIPFCCGIKEIGDVELEDNLDNFGKGKVKAKRLTILLIQYAFLHTKEQNQSSYKTSEKYGIKTAYGLLYTSNGVGQCNLVEEALNLLKKDFKIVSTTRNPSSKNILKLYVAL